MRETNTQQAGISLNEAIRESLRYTLNSRSTVDNETSRGPLSIMSFLVDHEPLVWALLPTAALYDKADCKKDGARTTNAANDDECVRMQIRPSATHSS